MAHEIGVHLESVRSCGAMPRARIALVSRPVPGPNSTTGPRVRMQPAVIAARASQGDEGEITETCRGLLRSWRRKSVDSGDMMRPTVYGTCRADHLCVVMRRLGVILGIVFVVFVFLIGMGFKPQAKFDRGVDKGQNRVKGDNQRLGVVAKVERDGKALVGDGEIFEPVLDDDGHLGRVARAQPIGDLDPRQWCRR